MRWIRDDFSVRVVGLYLTFCQVGWDGQSPGRVGVKAGVQVGVRARVRARVTVLSWQWPGRGRFKVAIKVRLG